VRLLDDVTDVMLGVDAAMPRRESKAVLSPGATLLLCTDGVFERRDQDIDDALADLAATMSELAPLASGNLEDFCRQLLDRQVGPHSDDDAALVVVHVPARAEPSSG
jgi:serine/threonine protein phosphatase PrpC